MSFADVNTADDKPATARQLQLQILVGLTLLNVRAVAQHKVELEP